MPPGTFCPATLKRHGHSPLPGRAALASAGNSEPSVSVAQLERCWLQKAHPGGFHLQGKEERDCEAGWGQRCPWVGEVPFVQTTINSSPHSLFCGEARMEGTAQSREV